MDIEFFEREDQWFGVTLERTIFKREIHVGGGEKRRKEEEGEIGGKNKNGRA